jgi:hypothetical protein
MNLTALLPTGSGPIPTGAISPTSVSTGALTATGALSVSGVSTTTGANVTPPNAMAALAIDTSKALNTKSISVNSTFTFSATPTTGTWFSLLVTNTDTVNARTLTIPSSYSVLTNTTITAVNIPANGKLQLNWYYTGTEYLVYGDSTSNAITIGATAVSLGGQLLALSGITNLTATGSISFSNVTNATAWNNGAVVVTGGFGAGGNIYGNAGIYCASGTAGIGYTTGAGGTVTQATSKSTGVTLNKSNGAITMNAAELAAGAGVTFTVTNSAMAANDHVVLNLKSGYTNLHDYQLLAGAPAAGSFQISVVNRTAAALSQAIVISFAIIRGVIA